MVTPLTLMAVHAHPDDESSSTGGVLARYADEGVRTVVVTCTNGELGDAPGGIKPGQEGHDEAEVARIRLGELERACETLGVAHLELLGYHDSGMVDWEHKDRPDVFCNIAVDVASERLGGLFERYRPDDVVTGAISSVPVEMTATRVIEPSLSDNDFFARKAIGWALREYAKTNPGEVVHYVDHMGITGLSRREALRNIPASETRPTRRGSSTFRYFTSSPPCAGGLAFFRAFLRIAPKPCGSFPPPCMTMAS